MSRLKKSLEEQFRDQSRDCKVWNPQNTVTVEIEFKGEKSAMIIGKLAEQQYKDGDIISGVLVEKGFKHSIFSTDDIKAYTTLTTASVRMSQKGKTFIIIFHLYIIF